MCPTRSLLVALPILCAAPLSWSDPVQDCYLQEITHSAPEVTVAEIRGRCEPDGIVEPVDAHPDFGQHAAHIGMFNDRPEVREVMRYLTTGESTKEFVKENIFLSAHRDTPLEWYASPRGLRYAQIFFGTQTFRFKASDLMPSEIAIRFWRGIVEWIDGGDLDKILQEIDDSWTDNE